MNLIKLSIDRPIAVMAAVILAVLFGLIALRTIPIQLSPDLRRPVIQITTTWGGAGPATALFGAGARRWRPSSTPS